MSSTPPPSSDKLSVSQVAQLMGCDPKTVTRWADAGRIPFTRTLGGHRRFDRAEIESLIASTRVEATGAQA